MLEGCCSFVLSEMVQEIVERCGGSSAEALTAWERMVEALKLEDIDTHCFGHPLTEQEAEEARVALPAVAFRLYGGKDRWWLCSMEQVKTPTGTSRALCVDSYKERMRISSPYWAEAESGTDPHAYLITPDKASLKRCPTIKDFFDHKYSA